MSSDSTDELLSLVRELLEEAEKEPDGELDGETSLVRSGLLDSLALLSVAEWVSDRLGSPLDLSEIDVRDEWDTVSAILAFVEERNRSR